MRIFPLAPDSVERHDQAMANPEHAPAHLALGRAGEEAAALFLRKKGIKLLARNWRPDGAARGLELDIVGEERGVLVFVEVKTRQVSLPGRDGEKGGFGPEANFTPAKRKNFVQAARLFLSQVGLWNKPCRFDLVCVTVFSQGPPKLEHHVHVIELSAAVGGGDTPWQPW